MATPHRIACGTMVAVLLPNFEAVREHDFVSPAFNTKLKLAGRTTHQPLHDRRLSAHQRSIDDWCSRARDMWDYQ